MNTPAYEPKLLRHPHARKGAIHEIKGNDPVSGRAFTDYQGEPDMFPDVTVKDPTTEAYYRSRGYLIPGEVPPPPAEYSEYPVMLVHPDHTDAIPDDFTIEKGEHGEVVRHRIAGSPEKFPAKVANSKSEEKRLAADGYKRAGTDNPDAIRTAKASPYRPDQKHEEFPKMVEGRVVDPNAGTGGPSEYPKWIGEKLVHSATEERALTGHSAKATVVEECVICGEGVGPNEPKGTGPNGAFHLSHFRESAPAAKPKATVHAPVLEDGREPLTMTARESRKAAREASVVGVRKKPGPKPKIQAEA